MTKYSDVKNIIDFEAFCILQVRIKFMGIVIATIFLILALRIINLNFLTQEDIKSIVNPRISNEFVLRRNNIYDRNGQLLATNLSTASLYANPQEIIEPEVATNKICHILNEKCDDIKYKLSNQKKQFIWLKRHITPKEQQAIHNLGIPGIYFTADERRIYPQGHLFAHIIGFVDIDGNGIAGIEKTFNQQLNTIGKEGEVVLSIDSAVQNILYEEVSDAVKTHQAIGGAGLIMNTETGEIYGMVSIPDFNPHHVEKASERQRFNQNTLGDYEMGSTMKLITVAMGLNDKLISINDAFDVSQPINIGGFQIHDYRGKGGVLSVPEILIYSSNLGTAQIIEKVGYVKQRKYLKEFGVLNKVDLEIPEIAAPLYPSEKMWKDVSMITISYGHGLAITPLHVVQAIGALLNGGKLMKPTLIKDKAVIQRSGIIKNETSDMMKKLMRMVVQYGSGAKANVNGYYVGGKTGTSEKITNGKYNKHVNLASFFGAFPMYDPKFTILILVDEAKPNKLNYGFTTGGMLAAPVAANVIRRVAPILNIMPITEAKAQSDKDQELLVNFVARHKELR